VDGNEEQDYFVACTRCELKVTVVDQPMLLALQRLLWYHQRRSGDIKGLALTQYFEPLHLRKLDRLEPTEALPDIGLVFSLTACPVSLVFWRPGGETIAKRRNPLFNLATGVTPYRCLTVDLLHALYLGIIKSFSCHCIWFLLLSGMIGHLGNSEERLESAQLALVRGLLQWYRARRLAHQPRT